MTSKIKVMISFVSSVIQVFVSMDVFNSFTTSDISVILFSLMGDAFWGVSREHGPCITSLAVLHVT